jgi:hypothetical protein
MLTTPSWAVLRPNATARDFSAVHRWIDPCVLP